MAGENVPHYRKSLQDGGKGKELGVESVPNQKLGKGN